MFLGLSVCLSVSLSATFLMKFEQIPKFSGGVRHGPKTS